ncbi:unnamed protein product [Acanthoscelides obtectus]|uniref:Uncharacterized protein n=1 Tax=Acanthoscelides obtectus TaxID=200917 RepID=A0A9P0NZV8_ACAOB|nr:unnamed protein product [Acanthoscelides obtectus]CAK1641102.1 hypothetical protein AOBTE_LOCUS12153 [Acanthoscelides obtectus]
MSVTRKNLLVPGLKISKELADDCLPGEFLFGSNLTQKLDTAKSLLNKGTKRSCLYRHLKIIRVFKLSPPDSPIGGSESREGPLIQISQKHLLEQTTREEETTLELDINYHLLKHLFSHKSQITLIIHMMKTN